MLAILDTHGRVGWRPVVSIWMTSPFSDSIVFTVHTRKQRFQNAPRWRAFSNDSVFGDRFRYCSVDDSHIRSKTASKSTQLWYSLSIAEYIVVDLHWNSIETRTICFLFLLENTATKKRKTACLLYHQNVNSLSSSQHYHHYANSSSHFCISIGLYKHDF